MLSLHLAQVLNTQQAIMEKFDCRYKTPVFQILFFGLLKSMVVWHVAWGFVISLAWELYRTVWAFSMLTARLVIPFVRCATLVRAEVFWSRRTTSGSALDVGWKLSGRSYGISAPGPGVTYFDYLRSSSRTVQYHDVTLFLLAQKAGVYTRRATRAS